MKHLGPTDIELSSTPIRQAMWQAIRVDYCMVLRLPQRSENVFHGVYKHLAYCANILCTIYVTDGLQHDTIR